MHLFKTLKYQREVGEGILNRPLSLHQRPFDEQTPTVSSGSRAAVNAYFQPRNFGSKRVPEPFPHATPNTQTNQTYMPSVRLTPTPNDCWLWL